MVGSLARSSNFSTPASGWAMRTCGSFWNRDGDLHDGHVVGDGVERAQHAAHVELDLVAEEQRLVGRLRAALHDGDLEAVFLVSAVGDRLIEAAVLGLGQPVGAVGNLVERQRRAGECRGHGACRQAEADVSQNAHVPCSPPSVWTWLFESHFASFRSRPGSAVSDRSQTRPWLGRKTYATRPPPEHCPLGHCWPYPPLAAVL